MTSLNIVNRFAKNCLISNNAEYQKLRYGLTCFLSMFDSVRGEFKCPKGIWWMPWQSEAMKDVVRCDKSRGAAIKL